MKKVLFLALMVFAASVLLAGAMPSEDVMKALDAKVDGLMAAYNDGNATEFYAGWASAMAGVCTPQVFQMMFVDGHMKNFGAYKSRKIIEAETVVMAEVPNGLLVYEAEFEKNAKIKLSINLMKENDEWKFQQVT
ncbi:MAG: hypothetical protein AB1403_17210, partial [Candidatus Riflebacteria bacterium]